MEQITESPVEERMAKVEGILEEVRARLNHLESDIGRLDGKIDNLRQDMNANNRELRQDMNIGMDQLRQKIDTNFRWMVGITLGILIPMWVTIILTILFTS